MHYSDHLFVFILKYTIEKAVEFGGILVIATQIFGYYIMLTFFHERIILGEKVIKIY